MKNWILTLENYFEFTHGRSRYTLYSTRPFVFIWCIRLIYPISLSCESSGINRCCTSQPIHRDPTAITVKPQRPLLPTGMIASVIAKRKYQVIMQIELYKNKPYMTWHITAKQSSIQNVFAAWILARMVMIPFWNAIGTTRNRRLFIGAMIRSLALERKITSMNFLYTSQRVCMLFVSLSESSRPADW